MPKTDAEIRRSAATFAADVEAEFHVSADSVDQNPAAVEADWNAAMSELRARHPEAVLDDSVIVLTARW